jgi:hypothetical protein
MVGLRALLSCPQREYAPPLKCEESPAQQPNQPDGRKPHDDAADHLDPPIPRPALLFASVSPTNGLPPPPGLGGPDSDPAAVPLSDISGAINVEPLEEEPPAFGENLRRIVQGLSIPHQPHTTFGLVVSVLSSVISITC